ncbi:MAG: hypothetical protein EZS28_037630 [Streblomastix strix]|uniref:Uncharacterized protein n=1 Tax=Streblomastix strix TaxID=222440 RepID=A0A5J4U9H4_9EUKA|nr:MAG: hypothetical protein EZS28_037630 [Streblomastix strix]
MFSHKLSSWRAPQNSKRTLNIEEQFTSVQADIKNQFGSIAVHDSRPCAATLPGSFKDQICIIGMRQDPEKIGYSPLRQAEPVVVHKFSTQKPILCTSSTWKGDQLLFGNAQGSIFLYKCAPISILLNEFDLEERRQIAPSFVSEFSTVFKNEIKSLQCQAPITSLDINSISMEQFVVTQENYLCIYNASSSLTQPIQKEVFPCQLNQVVMRPGSAYEMVIGGQGGSLRMLDTRLRNEIQQRTLKKLANSPLDNLGEHSAYLVAKPWLLNNAHEQDIQSISWHPYMTNWVASSGIDGTIRIWDLRRGMPKVPVYTLTAAGTAQNNNIPSSFTTEQSHTDELSLFSITSYFTSLSWSMSHPDQQLEYEIQILF